MFFRIITTFVIKLATFYITGTPIKDKLIYVVKKIKLFKKLFKKSMERIQK